MKKSLRSGSFLKGVMIQLLCSMLLVTVSLGQQLAFPGAEGGGRFATGGRGGTVYEVTNLNDTGAGSLRDGISQPNRTIIFRVSGVIHLASKLSITKNNITIAGQTAPGDGICLTGYTVNIRASNIIIRHIRCRLSDVNDVEDDAMNSFSGDYQNIIIDHCSLGWSVDETGTFYGIKNFTLQWCLLAESLYHSVHDKGNHGYGGIWGGENASFHHNLLAHHTSRNPRFCGSRFSGRPDLEIVDFRNNVLYNWGNGNSAYGGEGGHYNMVNNYYKPGPATPGNTTTSGTSNKRNRILNYTSYYAGTDAAIYPDTVWGGKFYIDGNYVAGYPDVTADNWTKGVQKDSYAKAATLMAAARQSSPFAVAPVTTQTAEEAYTSVLQHVGATLPHRDAIDERIISEVSTGTATYEGSTYAAINGTGISHPSGIIDTQADAGGLPVYTTVTPPVDTDHDGMPDAWETSHSLNPANANDGPLPGTEGYTNLENYLNAIASSETGIDVSGSMNGFVQIIGTPSSTQTYTVSGTGLSNNINITPPAGYEISVDGGINWHTQASSLTLVQNSGVVLEHTITVRLNSNAIGSYAGIITHTSDGVNPVGLPVSGIVSTPTTIPAGTAVVVAKDGSGDFTLVQAAINAAPTGRTIPYIIFIKNGVYKEKISIPSNKPFIQLYGESVANTVLTFDDYSGKPMPGGGTYGTSNSASVIVNAADFSAINITFENTTGDAPQALAINVNADRAAFKNCRFLGGQDTILTNGNGNRQYYKNCYIDGVVDFIFGNARALFDSCIVFAKSRQDGLSGSYITAANTQNGQPYGYVFRECIFPSNTGVTSYVLGRPWQNSTGASPPSYPKVVLLNATLGHKQIKPEGWSVWDAGTVTSSIYYGEHKSKKFNNDLVDVSKRVSWSFQLTDAEAATYTNSALFETWDPCAVFMDHCSNAPSIAVSNFRGKKGATTSAITWNISWAMKEIRYALFRSADNISFSKIHEQVAVSDTTVNFSYTDDVPPPGTTYYYYLVASRDGMNSHATATIAISSTPTIITTGSLTGFLQGAGLPSAVQGYKISGENLLNNITITPPAGYEISSNGGTDWSTASSPLTLVQSGGVVALTSIAVRLNAGAIGNYSGNITHSSGGAISVEVPVTGEAQAEPLPVSEPLLYWPLTSGNEDDATSRSPGVIASTSVFHKMYLSNGTTVVGVPAYSASLGQAFSPAASGEGLWTTASGGPGGNLNRAFYEQFTVTARDNFSIRIDSIILNASYYNTSSNTKLAVVFSTTGFASDSTNVTGGIGPDKSPLLSTANGGFTTPVLLANESGGTSRNYRFSLAGANGVTIGKGKTLTIRLYFSCGSTSPGRYAKVKDVYIKGSATEIAPVITTNESLNDFAQAVGAPSAMQTYTVAGSDLTAGIMITPPLNFEVSANGGTTWSTNASPLLLSLAGNAIAETTISVRLNASAAGMFSGNIGHTSQGAPAVAIAVSGTSTDAVTGLPALMKDGEIFISPNPVETSLVLHYPVAKNKGVISVYSTTGIKIVAVATEPFSEKQDIDVASLGSGLYLAEYCTQNERVIVKFIRK
jgi:pectin methylesterase-like acyl-CoA thioesterase